MPIQRVNEIVSASIGDTLTNIRTWKGLVYNVKEHGLVGDGVTDDTSALQALIELAISEGRKAIFFPPGTYRVTSLTNDGLVVFFGDNASFTGGYQGTIIQIGNSVPAFMARNAIINGNFDIWQRGTSFTTNQTTGIYTADRWHLRNTAGNTITVSRQQFSPGQTEVPNEPTYFIRISRTGTTSAELNFCQRIENVRKFAGKTVTLSFYAKAEAPHTVFVVGVQNFGSGGSPPVTFGDNAYSVTTSWKKFAFTFNVPSISGKTIGTDSYLEFRVARRVDDGTTQYTLDIAQVQLVLGSEDLPFQFRHFAEELALCQRYYEKSYELNTAPGSATDIGCIRGITEDSTPGGAHYHTVLFKVRKRAVPTVIVYGTGGTPNTVNDETADRVIGAGSFSSPISEAGFSMNYTLQGATSRRRKFHYVADAEL